MVVEEIFVPGDGVVLFGVSGREMRAVGAFSSFLVLSIAFFGRIRSGDEEEAVMADDIGGRVFNLIGTNALRISSGADSLPDSLGLFGGVLDGLLGLVAGVVVLLLLVFGGNVAYSVGYFAWSNGYAGRTGGGNAGGNKSGDGIGIVPEDRRKKRR